MLYLYLIFNDVNDECLVCLGMSVQVPVEPPRRHRCFGAGNVESCENFNVVACNWN